VEGERGESGEGASGKAGADRLEGETVGEGYVVERKCSQGQRGDFECVENCCIILSLGKGRGRWRKDRPRRGVLGESSSLRCSSNTPNVLNTLGDR
jgi:hypothetical protein